MACDGVLSFGLAGGLDLGLRSGTAILATKVISNVVFEKATPTEVPVHAQWLRALGARCPDAVRGALIGCDAPAMTREHKALLHDATGAVAIDMESHIAGAFALRHGLPFAALRVIADPAGQRIPEIAIRSMRANGSIDIGLLLRGLRGRYGDVGEIARLAQQARRARARLAGLRRGIGRDFAFAD